MYTYENILVIALGSYLLGSIPFGVVLAKLFRLPDPRTIGSGNIGATNMLRTGKKKVALLTLLLDVGKGAAAVLMTQSFLIPAANTAKMEAAGCFAHTAWLPEMQVYCDQLAAENMHYPQLALALLFAAIGHMYSPWLKFKGGKGVATILGGSLAFSFPVTLAFCVTWLAVFVTTRFVSLASIVALAVIPFATGYALGFAPALMIAAASAIAIYKHRANIVRLRKGEEPRMLKRKKKERHA